MHTGRMSCHCTKKGVNYYVVGYFPQTLRPIVYVFLNVDRNFANFVAPPTEESAKCLVHYKEHLLL